MLPAIAKYKPSLLPDTKLDALIAKVLRERRRFHLAGEIPRCISYSAVSLKSKMLSLLLTSENVCKDGAELYHVKVAIVPDTS